MTLRIEPTTRNEISALQDIELRAGALFRGTGLLPEGGETSVAETAQHVTAINADLSFTAHIDESPVGFVMGWLQPDSAYLAELSVDPDFGQRGIGRALVERFCEAAWAQSARCVTLSTFRDVPWNAPFYAKLGFGEIARTNYTDWMHVYEGNQTRGGLDIAKRLFMKRPKP